MVLYGKIYNSKEGEWKILCSYIFAEYGKNHSTSLVLQWGRISFCTRDPMIFLVWTPGSEIVYADRVGILNVVGCLLRAECA